MSTGEIAPAHRAAAGKVLAVCFSAGQRFASDRSTCHRLSRRVGFTEPIDELA